MAEPAFGKTICDSVFVSIGYADALRIKGREGAAALGVNFEGQKEAADSGKRRSQILDGRFNRD
jgi:hypothetical protein